MLVAFYPKSRIPDRAKVLEIIGAYTNPEEKKYFNFTDLDHVPWLRAIQEHRFVLAPFGHGLDTHRISEIYLMGGIPVMRRSSITSCFDDSDNVIWGRGDKPPLRRGSLPSVIVDRWEDLSQELLEREWARLRLIPNEEWDWHRILLSQWVERIRAGN